MNKAFSYHQHEPSGFGLMDSTYVTKGIQRWWTFKAALTIAGQRKRGDFIEIIETGCQREADDWGGGMSTALFADYCRRFGGRLVTIDLSVEHLERCKKIVGHDNVTYVERDSVDALKWGWAQARPIDLLYLDSFDYPYGKLLDIYGGKTDINKAIPIVAAMSEAEIVEKHGEIIRESQEHCLREVEAAAKSGVLGDRTVLLIDDNSIPGGGKPRLAKQWLEANGWTLVLDAYQTLWVKA